MNLNRRLIQLALCAPVLLTAALAGSASAYVNGHDALKDKPFVAGMRKPGTTKFFCTATLLHKDWVLTAAHCLDGGRRPPRSRSSSATPTSTTPPTPRRPAAPDRLELNPKWGGDPADKNDVALIHLSTPSTLPTVRLGVTPAVHRGNEALRAAGQRPPPQTRFLMLEQTCPSGRGKALGWGRTSISADRTSSTLREVTPKIFGSPRRTFWRVKSGACPGDSGGPLLALTADGSPRQIGIASYNKHGGGTSTASRATSAARRPRTTTRMSRVARTASWIESDHPDPRSPS